MVLVAARAGSAELLRRHVASVGFRSSAATVVFANVASSILDIPSSAVARPAFGAAATISAGSGNFVPVGAAVDAF